MFLFLHNQFRSQESTPLDIEGQSEISGCDKFESKNQFYWLYALKTEVQQGTNIRERLLNKPYVNEVTLQGKNHPWNAASPLIFKILLQSI